MTKILIDRAVVEQALEALAIGHDAAHEVAQTYHEAMAGYRPARHIAVDDDVRKIEDAITALKAALVEDAMQKFTDVNQELEAALAEPVPVAWMHVPYPGSGLRQMASLTQNREPSLYAATVPLYIKEQL